MLGEPFSVCLKLGNVEHFEAKEAQQNGISAVFLFLFIISLECQHTELVRQILSNRKPLGPQRSMVDTQGHRGL